MTVLLLILDRCSNNRVKYPYGTFCTVIKFVSDPRVAVLLIYSRPEPCSCSGEHRLAGRMAQQEPDGIQQGQMPSPAAQIAGTKHLQWYTLGT